MTLYAATSNKGKLAEFATSASTLGIDVLPLPGLATLPEPVEDAPTFQGNADLKAIAYSLASPGLLVFADDSGLEVDALHGEPGVRSARYADDAALRRRPEEQSDEGPPHSDTAVSSRPDQSSTIALHSRETRISSPPPIPGAPGPDPGTRASHHTPPLSKDARNNALLLHRLADLPAGAPRTARFICALALALDGRVLLRATATVEGEILPAPRGENGFGYDPLFLIPSLGLTAAELPAEQKWAISHRGHAFRDLLRQLPNLNL